MHSITKRARLKLWEWATRIEETLHPLHYLFWEATLDCNLHCRHCGSECQPGRRFADDELSKDEVIAAFKTVAEDYDPRTITIAITGGEPLLRRDFFSITNALHDMGFAWGMVTNGTLLTPEIAGECIKSGMATVAVSIDGMEETHDWLRGQGSFAKTVRAIAILHDTGGLRTVQITSCITPRALPELERLYRLCVETKVDEWRVLTMAPMGRACGQPELFVNGGELRTLLQFLQKCRQREQPGFNVFYAEEGFLGVEFEGEVRDFLYRCFAGVNIAGILYNGDIAACPNLPRHLAQGNVRHERFSKVWETKYQVFRDRRWSRCGQCARCGWWQLCRGNSLHLWDWQTMSPLLCHYRMLGKDKS
jgi:radical SAM protein with 4Fe4S-binding SPASM domain